MAAITFKGKIETVYTMENAVAWQWIKVPEIARRHCDMNAFRSHPKFGPYANSDLFAGLIRKQLKLANVGQHIRLDRIPPVVSVDTSGFLASVTINLD